MPDLVGRDQELGLIASFLKQAAADGATLLFTGEAGIGKTALLDTAAEAALAAGLQVVRAAGSEFGTEASFSGLAQLLQPLSADLPSLSSLHRGSLAAIAGDAGEPQPGRLAVFQAALALLGHAAGRRPLDAASAAVLLSARFPGLAPQVRRRLLAEAQGNPLALLELPVLLSGPQRAALAPLPWSCRWAGGYRPCSRLRSARCPPRLAGCCCSPPWTAAVTCTSCGPPGRPGPLI